MDEIHLLGIPRARKIRRDDRGRASSGGERRHRDEGGHGGKKDEGKNHEGKSEDGKNDQRKMISIMAWGCTILVLLISIGSLVPKAAAQADKYPKWPVDQYLMERNAE